MLLGACIVALILFALVIGLQMHRALGWHGTRIGAIAALLLGGVWGALEWSHRQQWPLPEDMTELPPVSSQTCFRCHESHYASWHRSYHRTMTREATPENVKADLDTVFHYQGVASRMSHEGERFFMDFDFGATTSRPPARGQGTAHEKSGSSPRQRFSVDRLVGSHWFQQYLHRDDHGRYLRLPVAYHLVERRWVHLNGALLGPDSPTFFIPGDVWNERCIYCHNTRPSPNRQPTFDGTVGYDTEVGELGIACEACHGAAERHVRAQQNPARRLAQRYAGAADPTIVNPARLSVARADDVCAHCHARGLRWGTAWNPVTRADPFLAGRDLGQFFFFCWSEAEMQARVRNRDLRSVFPKRPEPLDGTFWGDGTPMTTAVEYQAMALSACYEGGHGKLSCLSCHAMHQGDPNHQVKEGMRTNAACYACHDRYRERLTEHTHHAADSSGSLCYNCHMPYQVYSLLDTHRAHRITIPRVRDSVGTGKPHACNLCHLDKSLGWTQQQLSKWYETPSEPLSDDDRNIASSVLNLARSDARTRAVFAGAFSWPAARQASGRDWTAPFLARMLEQERYAAVRYLLYRAVRSRHGAGVNDYDYQGTAAERAAQLIRLRRTLESVARPEHRRYPEVPLTRAGRLADDVIDRLLRTRKDPDVTINE